VTFGRMTNSLFVSALNVALVVICFACLFFPRFTAWAQFVARLIIILAAIDVVLVLRDLWRSHTRWVAVGAIVLWLPIWLLILMVNQWEGPLYASTRPTAFSNTGGCLVLRFGNLQSRP
jgi:hypothetical protein